ncbi:MAG: FMN-binding protein [SAR86 cluster bacterium]|uniref:FMN-binding protein n=1 Tax=SAR86 cluster bacterium TaxID=2030880 RepID=A0A2A4MN98_9GAMM|nr:MAG: FMN-binding protein [SAR86 cluster bacterium]
MIFLLGLAILLVAPTGSSYASGDSIAPEVFLNRVFSGAVPDSDTVWLTGELRDQVEDILGHKPGFMRLRYWGDATRSAWVVDEIGKLEPITIGVVVKANQIEEVQVLEFRESRGWEIKHDFFTRQFTGVAIEASHKLNQRIDGISGATLSVKAMKNVSRMVLLLVQNSTT